METSNESLKLTDVELVALQMLFDRENEISCETRANDDFYPDGRPQSKEEIILDKISYKVSTLLWKDNKIDVGAPHVFSQNDTQSNTTTIRQRRESSMMTVS